MSIKCNTLLYNINGHWLVGQNKKIPFTFPDKDVVGEEKGFEIFIKGDATVTILPAFIGL